MSSGSQTQPFAARFVVRDPGILAPGAADAAHLVGPDDIPIAGEVRLKTTPDGVTLTALARSEQTAAVALPIRAGDAGTLLLQTCLLPSRADPYGLAVELARHRIKQFIQKSEDWQMWDPERCGPAQAEWDLARRIFAESLVHGDAKEAEALAMRSLSIGVLASERLTFLHADALLQRRFGAKVASSTTLGTALRPASIAGLGPEAEPTVVRDFDVISVPVDWRSLEPVAGKPDFAGLDAALQWAIARKKPVILGPLVDLAPGRLPPWVEAKVDEYEAFRDLLYDHVDRLARRYAGVVGIWNVASGVHANRVANLTPERMVDLARRLQVAVRQHARKANTLLEFLPPAGENGKAHRGLTCWKFLERLQAEGATPSAIGLRLAAGMPEGTVTRDLLQVADWLDRFAGGDIKLLLTGFSAPAREASPTGGHWREGWSPATQAAWAGRIVQVCLARPWIDTVFWSEASDAGGGTGAGLVDERGKPRPVLERLAAIRARLRKPLAKGPGHPAEFPWGPA